VPCGRRDISLGVRSNRNNGTGMSMTSVSPTVASVEVHAAPTAKTRNLSLDRVRTFLTLVVLIHHAVIPYTYFGHTDPNYWIGFDCIILATDSFFMAMFFFISGLFVWPSLIHKVPRVFFRDRLLRLGLPFVIAAFTIIPIAYYAISLRQHPDIGFATFWWKTITVGPWPSGPVWFLWVLLAFDLSAAVLYRISTQLLPVSRAGDRHRLCSRAGLFWSGAMVFVRTVRRSGQSRAALCGLLFHWSRRRRREF
jgi:hypothetical protein